MNYTKGEWKARKSGMGDWVISTEDTLICREARHFNAHLIAAAPEMYEALKLVQRWEKIKDGEVLKAINQSLAHAEGKP